MQRWHLNAIANGLRTIEEDLIQTAEETTYTEKMIWRQVEIRVMRSQIKECQ